MSDNLSIIIISYNSGDLLDRCLEKLLKKDPITSPNNSEWIIVDNASSDNSLEKVTCKYPNIFCIRNKENKGFAYAANQGYHAAKNQFLLYINPDVEIGHNAITAMFEVIIHNSNIAAIGPRLYRENMTVQKSVCEQPTIWTEIFKPYFKLKASIKENFYMEGKSYKVPSLRGACFLISKKALDSVNGFDEEYFFYLEETDLFFRLRKKGWQIVYLPAAKVIHYGGQSTNEYPFEKKRMYKRSLLEYFKKNRPNFEKVILEKILFKRK